MNEQSDGGGSLTPLLGVVKEGKRQGVGPCCFAFFYARRKTRGP